MPWRFFHLKKKDTTSRSPVSRVSIFRLSPRRDGDSTWVALRSNTLNDANSGSQHARTLSHTKNEPCKWVLASSPRVGVGGGVGARSRSKGKIVCSFVIDGIVVVDDDDDDDGGGGGGDSLSSSSLVLTDWRRRVVGLRRYWWRPIFCCVINYIRPPSYIVELVTQRFNGKYRLFFLNDYPLLMVDLVFERPGWKDLHVSVYVWR